MENGSLKVFGVSGESRRKFDFLTGCRHFWSSKGFLKETVKWIFCTQRTLTFQFGTRKIKTSILPSKFPSSNKNNKYKNPAIQIFLLSQYYLAQTKIEFWFTDTTLFAVKLVFVTKLDYHVFS